MENTNTVMLTTRASRYLALGIAKHLNVGFYGTHREIFGGGENYFRIDVPQRTSLMGKDIIFVGSTHTDEDFSELYRVGCALAGYGARKRIFVIPFFGYSTMERAVNPGEVVTAKTNARILSSIPNVGLGNTFLMLDLHKASIVHYFEGDCVRSELYTENILMDAIKELGVNNFIFWYG